jgi:hypothetical protein
MLLLFLAGVEVIILTKMDGELESVTMQVKEGTIDSIVSIALAICSACLIFLKVINAFTIQVINSQYLSTQVKDLLLASLYIGMVSCGYPRIIGCAQARMSQVNADQ